MQFNLLLLRSWEQTIVELDILEWMLTLTTNLRFLFFWSSPTVLRVRYIWLSKFYCLGLSWWNVRLVVVPWGYIFVRYLMDPLMRGQTSIWLGKPAINVWLRWNSTWCGTWHTHHLPNPNGFSPSDCFVSHQHRGCRNFKPKYISMADELISKYDDVEVYAVSCAPHKDICNKHKIGGYPVS